MSYCMKCGSPMKDDEKFCGSCGCSPEQIKQQAQQPQIVYVVQTPEPDRTQSGSYKTISYLFFLIFLAIGIIDLCYYGLNAGTLTYKSFIICGAAFAFLPQIKVSTKSPYIAFFVKLIGALFVAFFL